MGIGKKPFIIAGPCSAESKQQVHEIANDIKNCTDVFRAGIWKPRTNSESFQGIGKEALIWLQEVKQKHKIKVSTEVAPLWNAHAIVVVARRTSITTADSGIKPFGKSSAT